MSINWVMLSDSGGYTPLPGEQQLYASTARTSLTLQTLSKYPGQNPFSRDCGAGCVYLTNRRIIYLPAKPVPELESFAAPILNFQDTHVETPWFGPNVWTALVQPVVGGGIPSHIPALQLKMTFKDGGAFDLHSIFEKIKERLLQAVEAAGGLGTINPANTHIDELPAYAPSAPTTSTGAPPPHILDSPSPPLASDTGSPSPPPVAPATSGLGSGTTTFTPPADPPPGYEEVQRESIAEALERRLREDER